jgi:hypothetical protein
MLKKLNMKYLCITYIVNTAHATPLLRHDIDMIDDTSSTNHIASAKLLLIQSKCLDTVKVKVMASPYCF